MDTLFKYLPSLLVDSAVRNMFLTAERGTLTLRAAVKREHPLLVVCTKEEYDPLSLHTHRHRHTVSPITPLARCSREQIPSHQQPSLCRWPHRSHWSCSQLLQRDLCWPCRPAALAGRRAKGWCRNSPPLLSFTFLTPLELVFPAHKKPSDILKTHVKRMAN